MLQVSADILALSADPALLAKSGRIVYANAAACRLFGADSAGQTIRSVLGEEIEKSLDPMELLYPKEVPVFDKYDEFIPEELVRKGFAFGVLDVEDMKKRVREIAGLSKNPS